jgi:hypothetical protein
MPGNSGFQGLGETLARLDQLIENTENVERLRGGLGMRLALSMARELQEGKPLGADTSVLVAGWVGRFGQDTVDAAVAIAREFLTRPEELFRNFGSRLGPLLKPDDGDGA